MEKGSLGEKVLQRMRQKREEQQKNRPHNDVLKMETLFERQYNSHLKTQVGKIKEQVLQAQKLDEMLEEHAQELDMTGKRNFPRIIILPEFVASDKIDPDVKEFYRKTANTFLRDEILRKKYHQKSEQIEQNLLLSLDKLKQLEKQQIKKKEYDRQTHNNKRLKVLKQQLNLRKINEQIASIKNQIKNQREENISAVNQYQFKKGNLQSRKKRIIEIQQQILTCKEQIQTQYNPIAYRQHLTKIFNFQIKNQILVQNLQNIRLKVKAIEQETDKIDKQKLRNNKLFDKIGKLAAGRAQKRKHLHMTSAQSMLPNSLKIHSKTNTSCFLTEESYLSKSKELHRPKSIKTRRHLVDSSPRSNLNTIDCTSFPRHRSAFSKRFL